jgi:glutamine synthetase
LSDKRLAKIPTVARSLREALEALKADHKFLTKGDVFTKDMINAYIALKMEEVELYETTTHPIEYHLYYSS